MFRLWTILLSMFNWILVNISWRDIVEYVYINFDADIFDGLLVLIIFYGSTFCQPGNVFVILSSC